MTIDPVRGLAAVCFLLLPIAISGCSGSKAAVPAPLPEVSVVTIHKTAVPMNAVLPGRTAPLLEAQVRARVDGIVLRRDFREGADVKANERLFQIDPAPYRAALDSAKATLARAEANLQSATALAERYRVLLAGNGVSRQDYDNAVAAQGQASADVASGKAAVEIAGINLAHTEVVSPIAGRIGPSAVTQGAYVQASAATLMATVQTLDPMYVDLSQSSLEGLKLRSDIASGKLKLKGPAQAKVDLILEDGTRYPLPGTLQFTDVTVDPSTGSVTVRAIFPNPERVLLPGMFVRAVIEEGTQDNVALVPQPAVTHDASGHATALVVGPDHSVSLRTIQATRTSATDWVVEGGLEEGEKVIVAGVQKVRPGAAVRAVEATAALPTPLAAR